MISRSPNNSGPTSNCYPTSTKPNLTLTLCLNNSDDDYLYWKYYLKYKKSVPCSFPCLPTHSTHIFIILGHNIPRILTFHISDIDGNVGEFYSI